MSPAPTDPPGRHFSDYLPQSSEEKAAQAGEGRLQRGCQAQQRPLDLTKGEVRALQKPDLGTLRWAQTRQLLPAQ